MNDIRVGHGYDVHRLVSGRDLIIGGVKIDYEKGLLGHSDADVLLHAIMDAMLGALALGDIGKMFPDNDDRYLGADSLKLCSKVKEIVYGKGWRISNIDATVIAEAPKLAPYIDKMRSKIADTLGTDISRISIKATTEEKLGFTGSGEGIAAHAVCLLISD
jgi:2-C-methyl-D-erythritol 2,4-cyclodiphosphate synthase